MYSSEVLDHFEHPRNAGVLDSPHVTVQVENPVCGDVLKLYIEVFQDRIATVRFQAKGCVSAMACSSAITDLISGKTLAQAANLRREDLVRVLGGLPEASEHASHLAMDALAAVLKACDSQPGRVPSGQ